MIALFIVVFVIALIALLRIGVSAEFDGSGPCVTARIGFVPVRILPSKQKTEKKVKKSKKKKEEKPGKLTDFKAFLPAVKISLERLRRRLLIKRITVHYIAAGDDAYKTAMSFGSANAAAALITPILENNFRVKRRDFRSSADFEADEPYIYVNAAISLAVWEVIYIAICFIPPLWRNKPEKETIRKESDDHGQTSDRRIDGNHDAKDPGNG